jgi:hypothetical protein
VSAQFKVTVSTDAADLGRRLSNAAARQIPFATAKALTQLAAEALPKIRREMPFRFTIRSQRVIKGIRMNAAQKSDWPRVTSEVGTRDEFMVKHEVGGVKRAMRGAAHVAIPTRFVARQRTRGGRIPKRFRPRDAIGQGRAKALHDRRIIKLLPRKRRSRNRDARSILFLLRRRVKIKPRWHFEETVEEHARRRYGPLFKAAFEDALRTAR